MNNEERTGLLMWLPCYCISWIYKPTKKSRYMYSFLVYSENHKQTIQYTNNKNITLTLAQLHLLRQLALFKMNARALQNTICIMFMCKC